MFQTIEELMVFLNDPNDDDVNLSPNHVLLEEIYDLPLDVFQNTIYHPRFCYYFMNTFLSYVTDYCPYKVQDHEKFKIILNHPDVNKECFNPEGFISEMFDDEITPDNFCEYIAIVKIRPDLFGSPFKFSIVEIDQDVCTYNIDDVLNAFYGLSVNGFAILLENGFNPAFKNSKGNTIIHCLCMWKIITIDILKLFLAHPDFDPNISNKQKNTILGLLCSDITMNEDLKCQMITNIIEHPNIKLMNSNAIALACRTKNLKIVNLLLMDGRSNLLRAIQKIIRIQNIDLLVMFLNNPKIESSMISHALEKSKKIYMEKDYCDNPKFLKFLFDSNIEISNKVYNSFLSNAIIFGNVDILSLLLSYEKYTIDMNDFFPNQISKNIYQTLKILGNNNRFKPPIFSNGDTLYHCVFMSKNWIDMDDLSKINQYLLHDLNIDPTIQNNEGISAIHYICRYGLYDILIDIYTKYPNLDVNMTDANDNSLLSCIFGASFNDINTEPYFQIIKFFVQHQDIDLLYLDEDDNNIFHLACKKLSTDVLKFLIEDLKLPLSLFNSTNIDKSTPIQFMFDRFFGNADEFKHSLLCAKYLMSFEEINFINYLNRLTLPYMRCQEQLQTMTKEGIIKLLDIMLEKTDTIIEDFNEEIERISEQYKI